MNREAQAALLFLLGAALLRTGFSDQYLRYVKAGLRPLLVVAGAVLIATAVATVWYELRRSRSAPGGREPRRERNPGRRPDHAHREPAVSWLMVLPLLALVLVAPPALGSYSAMRTGTALQEPWGFPALPAGDPLRLDVVDYAGRAVYDHGRALDNRRISLRGFITVDRSGRPYLTRMVLNCCAADAQPVKIGLSGRTPPVLQPDTWLEVSGSYTGRRGKDPINGGVIPFIDVDRARPVPAPGDPYESWGG
ncbi:TIGR03943 family putative permease subunit [Streptomyces sp. NPDC048639]|uniref:TIGR03943 family putative permease subunit n=1 Tax=Streptomyces sp. NPDC048639 TaxID=3365581 RepID=UPI00371CF16B